MGGSRTGRLSQAICREAPKGRPLSTEKTWRSEGRPRKVSRYPQTPKKPTQRPTNVEDRGEKRKMTWPVIVTVDGEGHEMKWGLLSRNAAWKAGHFWEWGHGSEVLP